MDNVLFPAFTMFATRALLNSKYRKLIKERKKDIRHALWCNLLVAIHLHSRKSAENSCFWCFLV